MKEAVRKEILYDLDGATKIMEVKEVTDFEKLKSLSDHAIEDVALHKDLDIIAITVLLYSLYKTVQHLSDEDYKDVLLELNNARQHLNANNFGRYNRSIRTLFNLIKKSDLKVKEHLQDVMQAARIKKGMILLTKGLSMGQAAGLMGLSNWDLQQYAGRTTAIEPGKVPTSARKRMRVALKLFNIYSK